jgi:hypothetical protein
MELFFAVMAWGLGVSNYGPSRTRRILSQPKADRAIEAVGDAVRPGGLPPSVRGLRRAR